MNLAIIIQRGPNLNDTLASVKFNQHGAKLDLPIIICNMWSDGFQQAAGYKYGLFVQSGTVFKDIQGFIAQLKNYPHRGLIGHIVDHYYDEYPWLDPQAFLLELAMFNEEDITIGDTFESPIPIRSQDNIHDTYTPLWLRASADKQHYTSSFFGQKLIARMLDNNKMVSNWNQKLRDNKFFLYNEEKIQQWQAINNDYKSLAEDQLWIFNNEPMPVDRIDSNSIIAPASGLFWMLAASRVESINLVDISNVQLQFVTDLLRNWDGVDYGSFVIDFMDRNNVVHYNLDKEIDDLQRLKYRNRKALRDYINTVYNLYEVNWTDVENCKISIYNKNLVDYVLDFANTMPKTMWLSNILDYKYTLLASSAEDIELFYRKLDDYRITTL